MNCASCGRANRTGARFCGGCGKPLAPRCPACGTESEPDAQFCDACGAALATRPAEEAVARKVVTIVFADLIGSTSLHERLDAESVRRLMDRYYRALRTAVEAHGGTVVKLLGDGVMAAFGVPRVGEDDAVRAVRAAVDMQRAFRALVNTLTPSPSPKVGEGNPIPPLPPWERGSGGEGLGLRVAVNTGEVVVSADHADVVGDPVNVAARLQQEAHDGDVLIGESTRRLVSDRMTLAPFGALTLKGRSEKVAAYRVVSLDRPADAPATPFVGRDDELRRIMAVYDAAVAARGPRLAVILGSPGLGKSRLLAEFARRLGSGATVLSVHCDAAGGATFAPLADALRAHLRIDDGTSGDTLKAAAEAVLPGNDAERARIAAGISALLAGTPAEPEETFFVVRRFLTVLAATQPLVLAIDDLQEAEPLLLDLTEHLVQWSSDVPLFVLVAARPELRDARSSLAVPGSLVSEVVTLAGLDAGAATRLAANVIGADELPAALAGRVLATSEGNPLFVGELVRMLVQDGALKREGDRWTTGVALASFEMPPTIHALLAARIERLRPDERTVLERAAIVGRHFSRAAVAHLLPREMIDLDAGLEALRRSELIEPDTGWFLGEPVLRFHHMLIRDAAYRRLLKGTRAELHARFADWVETRVGETVEHDETIGWHLEQAHHHLRELGPIDAHGRALGERAARYLAAAGRRALARDDLPVAASLLGRALDLLDAADPARADLALDWCEALLAASDVGPAASAIADLGRWIDEAPSASSPALNRRAGEDRARLRAWHTCFAGQLAVLTDPQALRDTADTVAAAAAELAAAGDAAGEAKAHSVHALALARLGKIGACEAALDRALAAARSAGDRRRANAVLAGAPLAALWGPSPVTRASGRCLDVVRVLRITQGAPAVEAVALRCQAVLEALRGRTEAARRMIASSRRMVEELGITQRLLEADVFAGLIELLEGDAAAAERCLRVAYEGLRNHGLAIDAAQAAALLGRALLAQGRAAEAEALSHASEDLAGDDLKAAIAWRGVRAEALARRGEHAAAVEFARAAVDIAAATDALLDHADARLALTTALCAAGRSAEAQAEEQRVIQLWEAKGATLLAERARRAAGPVSPDDQTPADGGAALTPATAETSAPPMRLAVSASNAQVAPRRVQANAATACVSRVHAAVRARDLNALEALFADGIEVLHHPTGATIRREEGLSRFRLLFQTEDLALSYEHLATLGDSLLLGRDVTSFSRFVDRQLDFGASRSTYVNLFEVDDRGLALRVEVFADNRLGDAVSRMYERYAELLPESPERIRAATMARSVAAVLGPFDLERYAVGIAADVEYVDHRRVGFPAGRGVAELLRSIGTLLETADDVTTRVDDVLALRADAFLVRWTTSGTDRISRGAFEWQFLRLCVFGADGLLTRAEQFDLDRADAALARYDELSKGPTTVARIENAATRTADRVRDAWATRDWERFTARRAALTRAFTQAFAARDWDTLATLLAPDLVVTDHRLLGWEPLHGPAAYVQALKSLVDLAPDVRLRIDHVTMSGPRFLYITTWVGTREGGPFESPSVILCELDGMGLIRRFDQYDLDQLDVARARFEELCPVPTPTRTDPLRIPPNAATRASDRYREALEAGDIEATERLCAPDMVFDDRRRGVRLSGDRAMFIVNNRLIASSGTTRVRHTLVATWGERLALHRLHWTGAPDGGPFEMENLSLMEVDAQGHITAIVAFDPSDCRAASLEMQDRYARSDAARWLPAGAFEGLQAMNEHDLDRLRAALPENFVFHDHRRTGVGRLETADAFLASLAALFQLAPDFTVETLYTVAIDTHAELVMAHAFGNLAAGGDFEAVYARLTRFESGRAVAMELFEPEDLDLARARFAEWRPGLVRIPPNAASRIRDRLNDAFLARDWATLRSLASDDFVFDDRRKWSVIRGGVEMWIKSLEVVQTASGVRFVDEPIGTVGDRIVLQRRVVTGVGPEGEVFESEFILLTEIDAHARLTVSINFDAEDRRVAFDEAQARFLAGEAASSRAQVPVVAFGAASARRDWEGMRRCLSEDIVIRDGSTLGLGVVRGGEFIDALRAQADLAPDVGGEVMRILAWNGHGRVDVVRVFGTIATSGGAFEKAYVRIFLTDGDRIQHFECYDVGDADRAVARFRELCTDLAR